MRCAQVLSRSHLRCLKGAAKPAVLISSLQPSCSEHLSSCRQALMEEDSPSTSREETPSTSRPESPSLPGQRGQRKARPCPQCGEEFLYLKRHLMGSKHRLSKDGAAKAMYEAKTSTKPRVPCPFASCRRKGVVVQRLNPHLQKVHGLSKDQVKAVKGGLTEEELRSRGLDVNEEEESTAVADDDQQQPQQQSPQQQQQQQQQGDEDKATLDTFKSYLSSLDGGSHPAATADQTAKALGRMADSVGGLRAVVSAPTRLTEEGGFLSISAVKMAPGTVKTYLSALKQFASFALSRDIYPQQEVQGLLSRIPVWQTSLRKLARPHEHQRRLSDETRVEQLLADQEEGEETDDAREGRRILSTQRDCGEVSRAQFYLARDYLMSHTLKNNGSRSGSVIHMTWAEVDSKRFEDGHHVIRTHNKTMGVHGMANLVFDDADYLMLQRYRILQAEMVTPEVDLVFTTHKGGPLQYNAVSRALHRMMGREATATLLRKLKVVSWNLEGRDLGKLGRHMKHSPDTQRRQYFTFEDAANSVEVYREDKTRATWCEEEEALLRQHMTEYISAGSARKVTVETRLQQTPELRQLAVKFNSKQVQDKIRSLHKRDTK